MKTLRVAQIAKMIDHSLLSPQMTREEVAEGCELALAYHTASVCVRGYDVEFCVEKLRESDILVGTVVGFPHGNSTVETKVFETKDAIKKGAGEIDVVMPIGLVRSGLYNRVQEELKAVHDVCKTKSIPLKVIFENAYLDQGEIIACCRICDALQVDFIKTSTGFAASGALAEDVKLMKEHVRDSIRIKAAGGIRTYEQFLTLYELGASRFGTSATKAILEEARAKGLF